MCWLCHALRCIPSGMPFPKAKPRPCARCKRTAQKEECTRRQWEHRVCGKCWPKHVREAAAAKTGNLKLGRTAKAASGMLSHSVPLRLRCQAAATRWRVKAHRRGSGGAVRSVVWGKINHHVGSSLHCPAGRGGIVATKACATLALCQRQMRWQLERARKDEATQDLWIGLVATKSPAPKYRQVPFHNRKEWQDKVAGRVVALARYHSLLEPDAARRSFPRDRADTGDPMQSKTRGSAKFCFQVC